MPAYDAVENAVNFTIDKNFLNGFFKKQRMEVLNMSLTEFDQEEHDRNRRREGFEEGAHDKAVKTAKKLIENGISLKIIADSTGLPIE